MVLPSVDGLDLGGGSAAIPAAGVVTGGSASIISAWVLPRLAGFIPAKAKSGQGAGYLAGLLLGEGNPNPLANYLGDLPQVRGFVVEQLQELRGGQLAVGLSADVIQLRQLACRAGVGVSGELLDFALSP